MSGETVTVTGIAAGGEGVARLADGRAVFVPRTAPGDVVVLDPRRLERRRSWARGRAARVLEGGPDRVEPPCPHYEGDQCGGCQLQHLAYAAQVRIKSRLIGDALRRIGKLTLDDPPVEPAVQPFRYRAKVTLAAGRRGWGFHELAPTGRVFPVRDCHLADPRLMTVWSWLRQRPELLPPRARRLALRLDRDGRVHVIVESGGAPWQHAEQVRAGDTGADVVCWWQPVGGAARVVAGPETGFPATAFEQVNPVMGAAAHAWATAALGEVHGGTVWDLYGGIGDTAVALSAAGAAVVSVDADERAVAWARARDTVHPVRFIAARAEEVVGRLPEPRAAVLNPPRAGLHWDVTLWLTSHPVPRVVYVSCDPATLARDLARLAAVYRVVGLRGFDLFPQTAHVETVAVLEAA